MEKEIKRNNIPLSIRRADNQLRNIVTGFELLKTINPTNIETEKHKFYKSKYKENPKFKYKNIDVNPFQFKKKLLTIKLDNIEDNSIRELYFDTIESYFEKSDMISNLGTQKFLYNSLKYFGQPSSLDIKQANFLLMCPRFMDEEDELIYTAEQARKNFEESAKKWGLDIKVFVKTGMVARALALNSKRQIHLNKLAKFSQRDIDGLINHEIGVHLITSVNGKLQQLRIFSLGMPINTKTQEGLAVVSEYMTNNINLIRLRNLALRVLAVDSLVDGNDFKTTFLFLLEKYKLSADEAFYMTSRVYRGGGFTKDYLYLRGLRIILRKLKQGIDIIPLFTGKTSIEYLDTINYMIKMGYVSPPKYLSDIFKDKSNIDTHPILRYLLEGMA